MDVGVAGDTFVAADSRVGKDCRPGALDVQGPTVLAGHNVFGQERLGKMSGGRGFEEKRRSVGSLRGGDGDVLKVEDERVCPMDVDGTSVALGGSGCEGD